MLTMLNSEKTLVLYVLRLGLFVSSMSWCLESALRRCELRHSVTLKAELRRSIEVVLAGHHFVADLSTWFREVTDLSAASFCFDDQSGGILVLLKKKKRNSGSLAHSLSSSLQCYRIMLLSFLKKKKKAEGGSSSSEEDRYMRVLVKTFWPVFCLIHPGLKLWKTFFSFGERNLRAQSKSRDSTNDGSTWRFLLVARHAATLGLWRAIPRVGELPFLKGFSLWTDQSERVYFYWPPGPNPVVTISTRVGPGSRLGFAWLPGRFGDEEIHKKGIILQTSLTWRPSWPSLSLSTSSAELTRDLHDLAPSLAL